MAQSINSELISAITANLNGIIDNAKANIDESMQNLEFLKSNTEQYNEASERLEISSYVFIFMNRIKEVVEAGNERDAENIIRFHAYQIGKYGTRDEDTLSLAQRNVKRILEDLLAKHIEK